MKSDVRIPRHLLPDTLTADVETTEDGLLGYRYNITLNFGGVRVASWQWQVDWDPDERYEPNATEVATFVAAKLGKLLAGDGS